MPPCRKRFLQGVSDDEQEGSNIITLDGSRIENPVLRALAAIGAGLSQRAGRSVFIPGQVSLDRPVEA